MNAGHGGLRIEPSDRPEISKLEFKNYVLKTAASREVAVREIAAKTEASSGESESMRSPDDRIFSVLLI